MFKHFVPLVLVAMLVLVLGLFAVRVTAAQDDVTAVFPTNTATANPTAHDDLQIAAHQITDVPTVPDIDTNELATQLQLAIAAAVTVIIGYISKWLGQYINSPVAAVFASMLTKFTRIKDVATANAVAGLLLFAIVGIGAYFGLRSEVQTGLQVFYVVAAVLFNTGGMVLSQQKTFGELASQTALIRSQAAVSQRASPLG